MTTFEDGPAHDVKLMLKRSPMFLRVVFNGEHETWDALDELEDTPHFNEEIHVYIRDDDFPVSRYHILRRDSRGGHRGSGWFQTARYKIWNQPGDDSVLRDNEKWRAWARQQKQEYGFG